MKKVLSFGLVIASIVLLVVFMGGVISIRMPTAVLDALKKSRGKRINKQLMDSLILLSNSLRSGMDIVQGFELVSRDMLPPISDEFGLVLKNYQLGTPFEKALDGLSDRVESRMLSYIIKAIIIQRQVGGNLTVIFARLVENIREESKLETEYSQITACALIDFDGQKLTLSQLGKYKQSPDREVRRAAYNAQGKWLESVSDKIEGIYDRMVKVRTSMAKKLGFKNYHEMSVYRMGRIGYGIDDIRTFREQVKNDLVPIINKLKKEQAKELGINKVTIIDDPVVFKEGNPTPIGTPEEIFANGRKMYHEMSKETGEFIDFMLEHELFDVLSRKGKANGGYCTNLPKYKMPFIFANFNGTSGDIDVLTHEAGHAFAAYKAFDLPWEDIQTPGMETAEIHSMSMEFFAEKWMDLFFGNRAEDYKYMHLSSSLSFIPYGTIVDYFQELVYENPDMTPAERNETFKKLVEEFCPNLNADEIEHYCKGTRWQFQLHIFEYPFYYIDYCLAQTMSLEFYVMMNENREKAWETYLKLVSYAGTLPFPELVEKCGMKSPLKQGTLKEIALGLEKILSK